MEPEETKNSNQETYELKFTNGALANLKKIAGEFKVPENDLKQVVNKGIQILSLIKSVGTKTVIFENKKGERYTLDIDNL